MENTNTFMSREAVATMLGISTTWLEHNCKAGPAFYKLGHKLLRYNRDDVQAWLAARKVHQ
jgi:predicted DNA-binding transcriptional regulator AlpA